MPVKPNDKWARGNNHSFCFMADNIPSLLTYREAHIHHDAVKPFSKGASQGKRPLGLNRRYDRTQIRLGNRIDGTLEHPIIVSHFNTDIVTYYPSGAFTFNTGGYDSMSTTQIMQELLGIERFGRRKGKAYYFDGMGHAYRITHDLRVNADGHVNTDSAYMEARHAINKEGFKGIKAKYKVFTDYAKMVTSLTLGGKGNGLDLCRGSYEPDQYQVRSGRYILSIDSVRMHWHSKEQAYLRKQFFDEVQEALEIADESVRMEKMLPLVEFLSFSASTSYDQRTLPNKDIEFIWRVDNKRLNYFFNELLKFHHSKELFTKEQVPLGTIAHDTNYKYREYSTEACL
jgi:hypothetical protein